MTTSNKTPHKNLSQKCSPTDSKFPLHYFSIFDTSNSSVTFGFTIIKTFQYLVITTAFIVSHTLMVNTKKRILIYISTQNNFFYHGGRHDQKDVDTNNQDNFYRSILLSYCQLSGMYNNVYTNDDLLKFQITIFFFSEKKTLFSRHYKNLETKNYSESWKP